MAFNVLGTTLVPCSYDPLTGYFRDGCCDTAEDDSGSHVICVKVSAEFLAFSAGRGNDLSTPRPEYRFRGLQDGDRWCCAPCAGGKRLKPAWRRRWCWNAPTNVLSTTSRCARYRPMRCTP
jgi:uncharacterized protein (DUF2237 family)